MLFLKFSSIGTTLSHVLGKLPPHNPKGMDPCHYLATGFLSLLCRFEIYLINVALAKIEMGVN